MPEKMSVNQALDERDLLVKKIQDKIAGASFTDVKKHNEKRYWMTELPKKVSNRRRRVHISKLWI